MAEKTREGLGRTGNGGVEQKIVWSRTENGWAEQEMVE
jgi:hypothetical protein